MRFAYYCNIKINSTKTVRIVAKGNLSLAKPNPFAKRKTQGFDTMRTAVKNIFGSIAGLALMTSPMSAFSQEAPANLNIATTSVQPIAFSTFNDTDRSIDFVQERAAATSVNHISILVFSENRDLQREAYRAAMQLRGEIPVTLILGPSLGGGDNDANIQIYAQSVPVFEGTGAWIGQNHTDRIYPETLRMAREAHDTHFPRQLASLALAQN